MAISGDFLMATDSCALEMKFTSSDRYNWVHEHKQWITR